MDVISSKKMSGASGEVFKQLSYPTPLVVFPADSQWSVLRGHDKSTFKWRRLRQEMVMKLSDFELHMKVWSMFFQLDAITPSPLAQSICPLFVLPMKKSMKWAETLQNFLQTYRDLTENCILVGIWIQGCHRSGNSHWKINNILEVRGILVWVSKLARWRKVRKIWN